MNREKLLEILAVQSDSKNQFRMFAKIVREVSAIPGAKMKLGKDKNLYVTKGEADVYPCMVSHIDTVHRIVSDLYPFVAGGRVTGMNRVTMEQTGIGGDDKVGVFITLQCLERFDNFKAVFFRDEETGCNGSYVADIDFFNDCAFVLQCDRRDNDDFVTDASGVELSNKEFQDAIHDTIRGYGYKFAMGAMTDVMALKENGMIVCAANMSCGYYRPHCKDEYVVFAHVETCLDMCIELFLHFGHRQFFHAAEQRSWNRGSYNRGRSYYSDFDWDAYDRVAARDFGPNGTDFYNKDYGKKKGQTAPSRGLVVEEQDGDDEKELGECPHCGDVVDYTYTLDPQCDGCGMFVSEFRFEEFLKDGEEIEVGDIHDTPF